MQLSLGQQILSALNLAGSTTNLHGVPLGQPLEATVLNNALAGQLVTLQLADRQIQVRAEVALQQGQLLLLERLNTADQVVMKLISAAQSSVEPAALKMGSQLVAEVVRLLSPHQLLVNLGESRPAGLPAQMEIDVRILPSQVFQPGQRLMVEVLQLQPLSVAIRSDLALTLTELSRQILPQLLPQPAQLQGLVQILSEPALQPLHKPIAQFLQTIQPVQQLQNPVILQQSLQQSGVFMESQLANRAPIQQDLKANLLRLSSAIQQQLSQSPQLQNQLLQLPTEVRQALTQWLAVSQQPDGLPAQRLPVMNTLGHLFAHQTPAQLVMQLLLGQLSGSTASQLPVATAAKTVPMEAAEQQTLGRLRFLLREVENTVSRIQLNQLNMLREPEVNTGQQVWLMEVPIKDRQQLHWMQLQIERHQKTATQADGDTEEWQVTLKLETHALGLVEAAIVLKDTDVKITLTTASEAAAASLQADLHWLQEKLQALDLTVHHLKCRCDVVDWFTPAPSRQDSDALLDISV